jgi:hypothetical protein
MLVPADSLADILGLVITSIAPQHAKLLPAARFPAIQGISNSTTDTTTPAAIVLA